MKKLLTAVVAVTAVAALSACNVDTSSTAADGSGKHAAASSHDSGKRDKAKAPAPKLSVAQEQAISSAQSYLEMGGFSRAGLLGQLTSKAGEGFKTADAVFAVNHVKVDWNQQALISAKSYLDMGGFSRDGLMDQLTSTAGEGFTQAQALYAVNHGMGGSENASEDNASGAASVAQEQAISSAESYLEMGGFSRAGLMDQLTSSAGEGFKTADAVYAVNHVKVDWNQQALVSAKSYLDMGGFSRAALLDQLTSSAGEQFTHAQAMYAVNHVGL